MQVEEIVASASRNKTPVLALSWPQTKLKINAGGIQMDKNSLAHTSWNCKYHNVFPPNYRRRVIIGNLKVEIRQILRDLCNRKGITIHEAEACPDHIHMLVSIPPKYSVSEVMVYKRQEFTDNFRKTCQPEIQIWIKALLVSRVLCGYRREKCKENRRIHKKSVARGHGG